MNQSVADIVLVTGAQMPKNDKETHLLIDTLEAQGIRAVVMAWDQRLAWNTIPLVLIRTPWDYFERLPEFLAWAQHVDSVTRLVNPFAIVNWNCHKRYLLDLARQGVPVVPTKLLERGENESGIVDWTHEIVVKPAVSIGAFGTFRGKVNDRATEEHLRKLLDTGDVIVQPFVPSVPAEGEVSLVYFGGKFSHAIRKLPKPGDFRVQDHHGGSVHPYSPSAQEQEIASAALGAAPTDTVYARIDLVRFEGRPVIMELELIEPELFLPWSPGSPQMFVEHLQHILLEERQK